MTVRRLQGRRRHNRKPRVAVTCLRCGRPFLSEDPRGNRICGPCTEANDEYSPRAEAVRTCEPGSGVVTSLERSPFD